MILEGIEDITWTSPKLPDFLAKLKGTLTISLVPSVDELLRHTKSIEDIISGWSRLPLLDIFENSDNDDMKNISNSHRYCKYACKYMYMYIMYITVSAHCYYNYTTCTCTIMYDSICNDYVID